MRSKLHPGSKTKSCVPVPQPINLHYLLSTFYNSQGKRTKILADELNFPSDIYALKG
ncbi:MAG: hypothetical protein MUF15_06605 [Acidobacteria bacterium]|nr:hypothetical protein [Acidobacteriota bacterium]